jgi:ribosomal protein S21
VRSHNVARVHRGTNLEEALRIAKRRCLQVQWIRRTGEVRVRDPRTGRSVRINGRRKDSPRHLIAFLNRPARAQASRPPILPPSPPR